MANRASQNQRYEDALAWIDQAMEVVRLLPDSQRKCQASPARACRSFKKGTCRQAGVSAGSIPAATIDVRYFNNA
jgi:hypothetical protein